MVSLEQMKRVQFQPVGQEAIVTVEGAATWSDVYAEFKRSGLIWVVSGGLCPSVGVIGFTLGGGVGPVARQYGMAIDNVSSFELVTADGKRVVRASGSENPDLFWALKGGGGGELGLRNIGVVTRVVFSVHRGPDLFTWGTLCYPKEQLRTVLGMLFDKAVQPSFPWSTNLDAVIDADGGICLWSIGDGPKNETSRLLSDFAEIEEAQVNLREHNCFWEMISEYAEEHHYSAHSNASSLTRSCMLDPLAVERAESSGLLDVFSRPDMRHPSCDAHLIHFGGRISSPVRGVDHAVFAFRQSPFFLYYGCSWPVGDKSKEAEIRVHLSCWFSFVETSVCLGGYANFMDRMLVEQRSMSELESFYFRENARRFREVQRSWTV
uniref:FAD-binding PCMH-type domain-containing protein n=1 Tax=Chromera velia CCMP2878 TaxID=1169474 RepID=A0A0G4I4K1_9ALVE|eukprot:Cvel_10883.t1-p1 / transcript=Cvel_10883.t1 / gene=Cvel_10883 / organism=Chromera_velia_CCMP2878 / gene_product=hypothetical protein / transcript_product=hypothetical protein / location=Cvel_scaffold667:29919-31465(+) / protein_length=378 / sequence_SO=supercontig / SO=protein_coding / is_pseudo=false